MTSKSKKSTFQGTKDQGLFASSVFLETHRNLFRILEKSNPSQYDQIMDQDYNTTHIGGGTHRHFDGSHTFVGSYNKIKETTGSVNPIEYLKSHFNELVTPEGIPLFTLDKQQHEIISHQISEGLGGIITPGQIREFIRDFNSFNAGELCTATLGGVFMFLACRSGDSKAISRVTAINLCLGFATASPLQVIVGLSGLVHGLYRGKIKSYELLRGATPATLGLTAYPIAKQLFGLSKAGSVIFSIGSSIGTEMLLQHFEAKKKEKILKELGDDNPHYVATLTSFILQKEFMKLSLKNSSFSLATAI